MIWPKTTIISTKFVSVKSKKGSGSEGSSALRNSLSLDPIKNKVVAIKRHLLLWASKASFVSLALTRIEATVINLRRSLGSLFT